MENGRFYALVCTYDVPPEILSHLLTTAYEKSSKLNSSPNLLLLSDSSGEAPAASRGPTMPPVDPSYKSGFVGWTIEQIHCFIDDDTDYEVDDRVFIIADERTAVDETVVLVQCEKVYEGATEGNQNETGGRHGKKISTVRIAGKDVNSKAICVDVAVMSVVELAGSVDADGVYREKETSPKKGGQAPRKQF